MQKYGQQNPTGYQRPGSTPGYPPAPAVPPPYGAPQGYQSAAPQAQSQWAAPAHSQTPVQQQWSQPQQQAGGYNPGVYGAMPGGYTQQQQTTTQAPATYPPQQQDVPPPPPPKPAAFASANQHSQNWGQHDSHNSQQNAAYAQGQQGGFATPSGYQSQSSTHQTYGTAAPPSQIAARPGSIYGADQAGAYSNPSSAIAQHPPNSVLSPNEHNPAYIPPSLTGQGVQSYVPSNTNPLPGVYVPPPPDVPAWQQASHTPLQGTHKFKYTKPAPDPNTYGQGQQGVAQVHNQGQYGQQHAYPAQNYGQNHNHASQSQQPGPYVQSTQHSYAQGFEPQNDQYIQNTPLQYNQSAQPTAQPAPSYQHPPDHQLHQQQQQQQNQWQPTPQSNQGYAGTHVSHSTQQHAWQSGHQNQGSIVEQQHGQGNNEGIGESAPQNGRPSMVPGYEQGSEDQAVSPIQNHASAGFSSKYMGSGRTSSVSSIALGAIHAQRAGNRIGSPSPSAAREDTTRFSALGTGGPSDWEHFGGQGEEIDDEELFGAKKDGRQGVPVQLDSVEVVSQQVSPPQSQGEWPTPPTQTASTAVLNRDQYQPTPPPATQRPPPDSLPQSSIGEASSQQQSSIIGDASAATQMHIQQNIVREDEIISISRTSQPSSQRNTPAQQQGRHLPPPAVSVLHSIGNTEKDPHIATQATGQQVDDTHAAELRHKDEALGRLRADLEKREVEQRAETEQLNAVIETTKAHAEYERKLLADQIESMKTAAEQARNDTIASTKEKDLTIDRWKEDSEGKEDTIKEKQSEIASLRDQLRAQEDTIAKNISLIDDLKKQNEVKDNEISSLKQQIASIQSAEATADDLKQQLELERSKEPTKPTPAALIPDLDPWYANSLERYISMLRSEARETQLEDKINVFTSFLKDESTARGLEYYSTSPSQLVGQPQQEDAQKSVAAQQDPTKLAKSNIASVQIPSADSFGEDDTQYSPGGRPIVQHRPVLKSEHSNHPEHSVSISDQSTTILTPTSSQDENLSQTPTPVQSPPAEQQAQLQYKPYTPPSFSQTGSVQIVPAAIPPVLNPTLSYGKNKDEIFFGASAGTSSPPSKPNKGFSTPSDVPVPAPLFTQRPPAQGSKFVTENPVDRLTRLLPAEIKAPQPNQQLESIRKQIASPPVDPATLQDLTIPWEKSASLARKKNDESRRKRQEESEEQTDQLFNDHEIAYADIAVIEDEFKGKERKLKADEDRAEYQSYVDNVFDKVYDGLQQRIKSLMDSYIEVETLLSVAVSGIKSFEGSDAAVAGKCLNLQRQLFEELEQWHKKVVEAVAERDKRYKKTEVQPLYAAGNITKMKQVEKHFANAEKEAAQRARAEKADRVSDFVRMVESAVIAAVGIEQQEIQDIIDAMQDLNPSSDNDALFAKAKETVLALGDSSRSLLLLLNDIEITIGGSILKAELAVAKEEKEADKIKQLEKDISDREKELKEEFQRKEVVLNRDREDVEKVIRGEGRKMNAGSGVEVMKAKSEEELKKERLSKALEAAKRRNGDL